MGIGWKNSTKSCWMTPEECRPSGLACRHPAPRLLSDRWEPMIGSKQDLTPWTWSLFRPFRNSIRREQALSRNAGTFRGWAVDPVGGRGLRKTGL
jgi:hypothetical protein